ncbi:unnamed protein product [Oikopleura dioica]|uniref:RING-type domain-containing protein n=1 Tax=Oikopleura dioica TaxID=34765 RepID=E4XXI2_OIKDI|nr:unnamed protein product [Oikopleura dioica]
MQEDMDMLSEKFSCGICCNSFAEVTPVVLSRCSHVFCQFCVEKVRECPACRKPIFPYSDPKPLYFV